MWCGCVGVWVCVLCVVCGVWCVVCGVCVCVCVCGVVCVCVLCVWCVWCVLLAAISCLFQSTSLVGWFRSLLGYAPFVEDSGRFFPLNHAVCLLTQLAHAPFFNSFFFFLLLCLLLLFAVLL